MKKLVTLLTIFAFVFATSTYVLAKDKNSKESKKIEAKSGCCKKDKQSCKKGQTTTAEKKDKQQ